MNWLTVGSGSWRWVAGLAVALLALAALSWPRWAGSRTGTAATSHTMEGDESMIPGLDRTQPNEYLTATFALG